MLRRGIKGIALTFGIIFILGVAQGAFGEPGKIILDGTHKTVREMAIDRTDIRQGLDNGSDTNTGVFGEGGLVEVPEGFEGTHGEHGVWKPEEGEETNAGPMSPEKKVGPGEDSGTITFDTKD